MSIEASIGPGGEPAFLEERRQAGRLFDDGAQHVEGENVSRSLPYRV